MHLLPSHTPKVADHGESSRIGRRVATIVLNYNSEADLKVSVPQLIGQQNIHHTLIIVDNASSSECVQRVRTWLHEECTDAIIGSVSEVENWVEKNSEQAQAPGRVYLILNHENRGYSAGNNIGLRLADALGAEAALIANPDMRIEDPSYLEVLSNELFADEQNFIAASRIVGLDCIDQNPIRESTFWEELLWPRFYFSKLFGGPISYILPITGSDPVAVPKVSGCCLMLRMKFLKAIDYLDEGVFLYCEEPILAVRVRKYGGRIIYVPTVSAVHAHIKNRKGNVGKRMLLYIKSRKYYLKNYSGYKGLKLRMLLVSYALLSSLNFMRSWKK